MQTISDGTISLAIACIMLAIGLTLQPRDFLAVARRPRAFAVGLAGQLLLVPALGFGLAMTLDPIACLGLAFVAVAPGGGASTLFTAIGRGDVALSVMLTAASNLLAALWVPPLLQLAFALCGSPLPFDGADVAAIMLRLALISTLPILLGVGLAWRFPRQIGRWRDRLRQAADLMVLLLVVWILWAERDNLLPYLAEAGSRVPLLLLLAAGCGWLAARLAGLGRPQRLALLFEWGVQNAPVAILVALAVTGSEALAMPSAAYGIAQLMTGALLLLALRLGRRIAVPA